MMWLWSFLRFINGAIDFIVYSVVDLFYQLFMLISSAGLFSQEIIQEFATRIYVFLGLIMVFKVSISLVSYILNPDNFAKADVGAPALLKGFVFALVGIVLVPYAFEAAFSLQRIILKDNLIGNLILGSSASVNVSEDDIKNGGRNMAFTSLTAFIRLDTGVLVNGEPVISEACSSDPVVVTQGADDTTANTGELSSECSGLSELIGEDAVNTLVSAYTNRSVKDLTSHKLLNISIKGDKDTEYVFTYTWLISTLAGGFMAYVLLLFCLDIAIRSVKLSFLQLIAPIPLISRIDPKKGKDLFGKWTKEVTSTYLDVFVRLIAIYFVLFVISALTTSGNRGIYNVVDPNREFTGASGLLVKVFIILGALSFAKELPNVLKNLFGLDLKASGGFTLNPAKKIAGIPLVGNGVNNVARNTVSGFDALKNGYSFRQGYDKSSLNDKGMVADFMKAKDKMTPYSSAAKKSNFDAQEKDKVLQEQIALGESIKDAIEGKKDKDNKRVLPGNPLNQMRETDAYKKLKEAGDEYGMATLENKVKAEGLFSSDRTRTAFQNMANDKRAKELIASNYSKAKLAYERGESNLTEQDVANLEIETFKAESKYKDSTELFNTVINASPKEKERYEAYSRVDNMEKSISGKVGMYEELKSKNNTTS